MKKLCWIVATTLFVPTVMAEIRPHGDDPWAAQAELGTIFNSGNSNSMNLNGKFTLEYLGEAWYDKLHLESQYGTNEGQATEERYGMQAETRYKFTDRMYTFASFDGNKQKFKPYEYVLSESFGLGRRMIEIEGFTVDLQSGPGGRHSIDETGNDKVNEFIVESVANAAWKITDTATFKEELKSKAGASNNYLKSTASIQTKFVGHLGMKLSYELEYNSKLPPDGDKTKHFDNTTSVTMVYDF